jgi:hypothetical protein
MTITADGNNTVYWAYENWRAHGHRVTVHVAVCGHCNNGTGRGGTALANGRWLGPFLTVGEALAAAPGLGVEVRRCRSCAP